MDATMRPVSLSCPPTRDWTEAPIPRKSTMAPAYSRPIRRGFEIELAFRDKGRRRETRVVAGGAAKVEAGKAMGDNAIHAEVINVSEGGLQLLCDRPVEAGETTRIVGENVEKLCRVRYCIKVAEGYRLGVQFCEGVADADTPDG